MSSIVIDGLSEEDFRRSIQNRLREGKAGSTIVRLRALLEPFVGPQGILPERFLTAEPSELDVTGWEWLGDAVKRHDRPGRPINAVSVAFSWAGEDVPLPDEKGCLRPFIETSYYNDDSFPFSQSSRDDLLQGYSFDGCTWSGDPEATDNALGIDGIDDLYGALALLEAALLASDEPEEEGLRAGSVGACLLSALLIEAVTQKIERDGVPRPLCVTAGSSGVYPYFDAPIAGMSEEALKAAAGDQDMVVVGHDLPVPRYSSLLMTGIPRAKKRAVLVLEETEDELANRIAGLRGLVHADREAVEIPAEIEPVEFIPEQPELLPMTAEGSPLLVKKAVKQDWDFRDMLSTPAEPEPEPDLQQRLQSLIASHVPEPIAETPAPVLSFADAELATGRHQELWDPDDSPVAEEFDSYSEPQGYEPRPFRWVTRWLSKLLPWRS